MTSSPHPALASALSARGFTALTAVQTAVLDPVANGRDLLVSAQTGSGKTVAFGIAMAAELLGAEEKLADAALPLALIVAPTRELAMQVQKELVWLYSETGARVTTCVGGMDPRAEARLLEAGTHIVVGTPGRLRDHLERGRLVLSQLKCIVLDEADEMLDMGFREDLEFILDHTPAERRTLLLSATLPREIEALAGRYQRDAHRIQTIRRDEQHADIEYQAIRVAPHDVENAVVNVLRFHEAPAALVFCSTREGVKRMHARLMERGFSAVALSGELSQEERTLALQSVRDGRARLLVATDVAARGLDLPDLGLVIHAELPHDRETLLHRSGRTGRAGRKGLCVIVVPFHRRRKAEALVGAARLKVTWGSAPTPDEIRRRDQDRLLADPVFTEPMLEEEAALVDALKAAHGADAIALALARLYRAGLPAPEDVMPDQGPPARFQRDERGGRPGRRNERERAGDRGQAREWRDNGEPRFKADREKSRPREPRREKDGRPMVWFRLDIGRERNADPRWLLPIICRAGGVSKENVGAIKIFDRDSRFEIAADMAETFAQAVKDNPKAEGNITRAEGAPPRSATTRSAPPPRSAPRREGPDVRTEHGHRDREDGGRRAAAGPQAAGERREHREHREHAHAGEGRREHGQFKAKKPHRKGPRPPHGAAGSPARPFARKHEDGRKADAPGRPVSKYAQKKKHRASETI